MKEKVGRQAPSVSESCWQGKKPVRYIYTWQGMNCHFDSEVTKKEINTLKIFM